MPVRSHADQDKPSGKTKANNLASLLPWAWKASQAQTAVNT